VTSESRYRHTKDRLAQTERLGIAGRHADTRLRSKEQIICKHELVERLSGD
jgi:hypothetical protein